MDLGHICTAACPLPPHKYFPCGVFFTCSLHDPLVPRAEDWTDGILGISKEKEAAALQRTMEQACPCAQAWCAQAGSQRDVSHCGTKGAPGGLQPKPQSSVMWHCSFGNMGQGRSMCKARNWILSHFSSGFPCGCELCIPIGGLAFRAAKLFAPRCHQGRP